MAVESRNLRNFKNIFMITELLSSGGLNFDEMIFDGPVDSEKRINVLFDDLTRHYHVIASLTGAMTKRFVCRGFGKGCETGETNKCKETCSDCMSVSPCTYSCVRITCISCNKNFRSQTCFDRHKTMKLGGKTVCERKRICAICGAGMPQGTKHECLKKFCANCKMHREFGPAKEFIAS
jgi:hypothetical protein